MGPNTLFVTLLFHSTLYLGNQAVSETFQKAAPLFWKAVFYLTGVTHCQQVGSCIASNFLQLQSCCKKLSCKFTNVGYETVGLISRINSRSETDASKGLFIYFNLGEAF